MKFSHHFTKITEVALNYCLSLIILYERLINHIISLDRDKLLSSKIRDLIIKEVQTFIGKDKPNDDITVLVIRIK
jgi:hypothetical protein